MKLQFALLAVMYLLFFRAESQCPTAAFSVSTSVCIGEDISVSNTSVDASSYEWNFCSASLIQTHTTDDILDIASLVNTPTGLTVVHDGSQWFTFVAGRASNNIVRLELGENPLNTPSASDATDLGNVDGLLNGPESIEFFQEGASWLAFVTNYNTNELIRLDFGTSLSNAPTATTVALPMGISFSSPSGSSIHQEGTSHVIFVTNRFSSNLTRLEFGASLLSDPIDGTNISISGSNRPRSVSIIKDCDSWYGFVSSETSGVVHKLSFGTSLLSNPAISDLTLTGDVLSTPFRIRMFNDGDNYVGTLSSAPGNLYRITLGSDISVGSGTIEDLGDFGSSAGIAAYDMVAYESHHLGVGIGLGSDETIHRTIFSANCTANVVESILETPSVSYASSGSYQISLKATDFNGNVDYVTESITVTTDTAPDIDFTVGTNICIDNVFDFTSSNVSGDITSYSWDFDEDGLEESTSPNPTYDFGINGVGTYAVSLTVTGSSGCSNQVTHNVSVFNSPVSSFTISGDLCSNTSLDFTNTSTYDAGAPVSWAWDFNSEGSSNLESPSFTFLSEGDKTVTLTATLPDGCESVSQQMITLLSGPSIGFEWSNNCFGSQVQFSNQSETSGVAYSWDFGDGSATSSDFEPMHQYAAAGDYDVILTVDNGTCLSVLEQTISVNDQSLVEFDNSGTFTEDVPITFEGEDLTLSGDFIISWQWNFDGEGLSNTQNATHAFSIPGIYTVSLSVMTDQGCVEVKEKDVTVDQSVCPTPLFTISSLVCQNQEVEIVNSTANASSYEWKFCSGGLSQGAVTDDVLNMTTLLNNPTGLTVMTDNSEWFVFIADRGNNKIVRLALGSDPMATPSITDVVDLGNIDGLLNGPESIKFAKEGQDWYGLVTNYNSNQIVRLFFGSSLTNTPSASIVTLPEVVTVTSPSETSIHHEGGEYVVFVTNRLSTVLNRLSFGASMATDPSTGTDIAITGSGRPRSVSIVKDCENWYGFVSSEENNTVQKLSFGTSLLSTPGVSDLTLAGDALDGPFRIRMFNDTDSYYATLTSVPGNFYRLNLGQDISATSATVEDLGDFGSSTGIPAYDMIAYQSHHVGFGVGSDRTLRRVNFSADCSASIITSALETPSVSFSSQGTYQISLKATDSNGNTDYLSESVTVTTDTAPSISFTFDTSRCISNTNTFTPSTPGLTYSWDFNDDGIEDSNLENPSFQLSLGENIVRLDVDDGTCPNFTEQTITIYQDPPTPTFTVGGGLICKNTPIAFTNTTDESQHTGVLTYEWDFNGEGISNDANPSFSFNTPGTKQITLKSIIPGCENISSAFEIEVSDGPTSAFNASSLSICETESISFTDQSTNNPVSWEWDFDDGFSSNAQNPDHLFSDPGNFNVSLTVTDVLGCQNTLVQEVSVSSIPVVSFDFDIACTSSEGIQFMDLSTVSGADIVSRTWYIGDTPLAEAQDQQNPLLTFESEGTVNVRLETVSSTGCASSHSEDIQILAAPQPDFSVSIGCEGELSTFSDISLSPGNQITSRLWTLDGANYTTEEIDHTFSGPGIFEVTLEVTGQNFCSETITREIEVLELLTVNFNVDGDCSNELIELSDQSTVLQDPIISREWSLDGNSVGNGSNLTLASLPDNTYELMLEVTTASGCVVSTTNNIVINRAPQSAISSPKTFGVPGDAITFTNESSGGSTYHWLLNGDSVSNTETEETFLFPDPGTYQISMVADNDLGCSDTTTISVFIALPEVDLSIGQFEVVENDGKGTIFLEIQNNSNLPIDNTEVVIELENQFSVTEQITSTIGIGESQLVSLNVGVPLNSNELSYLCVSLNSQYNGFDDNNPLDNEKCIAIEPQIVVEAPFPNPVTDQVRVRLVAPGDGPTVITLLNSAGKVEMVHTPQTQEGLNNFFLDLKALTTGVYFIRIELAGTTSVQRIIKL